MTDPRPGDPRLTEAVNQRTIGIDCADAPTIVATIQAEDRAVPSAVASQLAAIAETVEEVAGRFRRGGRLIYAGAGTSGRLGVLDASECPPTFGTDPEQVVGIIAGGPDALVRSSEGAEDEPTGGARAIAAADVGPDDFVLGIATSGTTPFVHGALEEAGRRGAGLGFLSCSAPPDPVVRLGAILITPLVGPEVIAGSTRLKAGTATKLILNTITTGAMIRSGRVYRNLMVDLRARSAKLVDRGVRIVVEVCEIDAEAARRLLLAAGGAVKTALAMHALRVDRGFAERALDTVDGFLRVAIDRYGGGGFLHYAGYPERPGWPDRERLIADLLAAPERLRQAEETGRAADAAGERVPVSPGGWSPGEHLAHLLQFEVEAVTPRVESASSSETPVWEDWLATDPPPDSEAPFDELTRRFAEARGRTVTALREAGADGLDRTARLGSENVTLYQFLRGIRQHDEAHARRIEQRVHPDLLRPRATDRAL
ncbi:MAG: N-acetylmuramic acid 6-phosphate etherase [Gemmatimonadota bacterium]|nr:N-acetylmuramic acid 6-phosphate etherase [Gemmatimonadota bacterium]